jgi:hypothetical protein
MSDRNAFADAARAPLFERAEARFNSFLAEKGASHPTDVSVAVGRRLFRRAVVETAAANFQGTDAECLVRASQPFTHPAFYPALERVRDAVALSYPDNIFRSATGVDAAVVLAGFGLPVAPFDPKVTEILEQPSNDIDTVLSLFAHSRKNAVVGYSLCDAPFYVLLTNCIQALRQQLPISPELTGIQQLFNRTGAPLPRDPGRPFEGCMMLVAREPGDTISSVGRMDPNISTPNIVLLAGWKLEGVPRGGLRDGYHPFPWELLDRVVFDTQAPRFLSRLVGFRQRSTKCAPRNSIELPQMT